MTRFAAAPLGLLAHAQRAAITLALVALLVVATIASAAQPVSPAHRGSAVEDAIRAALSARWDVDAERVVVDLIAPVPALPAQPAGVRLDGGVGGVWLVQLLDDRGAVTIALRVRAGVLSEQYVAARPIARGTLIDTADIATRDVVRWGTPAPASASPDGWQARRSIAAGEPLLPPAVSPRDLVRAGDVVRLTYTTGAVTLTTQATALGSAPLGARVAIRLDNGRRLETLVSGPGAVRISSLGNR